MDNLTKNIAYSIIQQEKEIKQEEELYISLEKANPLGRENRQVSIFY